MSDKEKGFIQRLLAGRGTDPEAQALLGDALVFYLGETEATREGYRILESAAGRGSAPAVRRLIDIAIKTDGADFPGLPSNVAATAIRYGEQVARAGDLEMQNKLGIIYAEGLLVPKDYATSSQWYKRAAEADYAWAQVNLAGLLEKGYGVAQNQQDAAVWYAKAALQDNSVRASTEAAEALKILYNEKGAAVLSKVDAEQLKRLRAKYPQVFIIAESTDPTQSAKKGGSNKPSSAAKQSLPKDFDVADQVTSELKPGDIVFNPRPNMTVGVPERVTIRIGDSAYVGDLKADLGKQAPVHEEKILTGRFMSVTISGVGFDIDKSSPGLQNAGAQVVPKGGFSEWSFFVTPLESGKQKLLLTASVRVKL